MAIDPDQARAQPLAARRSAAVLVSAAALGLLPFALPWRLPPSASFWHEWLSALAAIVLFWMTCRATRGLSTRLDLPVTAVALGAVPAMIAVQLCAGMLAFPATAMLSIGLALVATSVCVAATTWRPLTPVILDGLGIGLLVALVLNVMAVGLELSGFGWHAFTLYPRPFSGRATGLVGQPNQLAVFCTLAWCGGHYMWLRGRLPAVVHLGMSIIAAFLLAVSGSRAGGLTFLLALGLALWGMRGHACARTGYLLLAAATASMLAGQFIWGPAGLATYLTDATYGVAAGALARNGPEGRIELWRDSVELIALHPWRGVGWRGFSMARWDELSGSMLEPNMGHAHNLVLNLAVEFGVVGTLLVLVPLGWGLWCAVRAGVRRQASPQSWFLCCLLSTIAVYSLFEFPLWFAYFLLPFALALGLSEGPVMPTVDIGRLSGWLSPAVLFGLFSLLTMGYDYRRLERVYTDALLDSKNPATTVIALPLKEISDISLLTANDLYADQMFSRVLSPDGLMMEEKLAISGRVLAGLTTGGAVARHVANLAAAGRYQDADAIFVRAGRNPAMQQDAFQVLSLIAEQHGNLKDFVMELARRYPQSTNRRGSWIDEPVGKLTEPSVDTPRLQFVAEG